MLLTKFVCFLTDTLDETIDKMPMHEFYTKSSSPTMWRHTLCQAAKWQWGGPEGENWRIVQDRTIIGFHARNNDGETIELR